MALQRSLKLKKEGVSGEGQKFQNAAENACLILYWANVDVMFDKTSVFADTPKHIFCIDVRGLDPSR